VAEKHYELGLIEQNKKKKVAGRATRRLTDK